MVILIVDDEPDLVWILAVLFEDEGYEVVTAANGHLAFVVMQARRVHLVLCDVQMPVLSGIGLRKKVEQAGWGAIPFIFMSARPRHVAQHQLDREHPFIQKPFTVEAVSALVREVLDAA